VKNRDNPRDFYDNEALVAARYSTKRFWESRYHNKRRGIIHKLLRNSLEGCRTFLDVGCGTGEYLPFVRRFVSNVCGFDISKEYLYRCKPAKADELIQGDSRNLPFKDRAFDVVLCSEMIEHVNPQEIAIREIFRVSRKSIVLSTPNHGILRVVTSKVRKEQLAAIDEGVGHVEILRISELKSKLKNHVWKISVSFTTNIFPPFLDTIRLPRTMAPLIDVLERLMDALFPSMGSVTVISLESNAAN
jgi:ubiquinone/menaquinone biosynthesis C-methylase UbiE